MNANKNITANFRVRLMSSITVLIVVGDANSVGVSDQMIGLRMVSLGYNVQVTSDEVITGVDATGKALVLTSSPVGSGVLNTKFRDVPVPVINWETLVQDDYGFTNTTSIGNTTGQTTLNIINATHPLATGLFGDNQIVATPAGDFSWGVPGGSPITIAQLGNGTNSPCLYAYEAGSAMTVGIAPARQVNLFLQAKHSRLSMRTA
jgi:hypothetical protein